MAVPRWRGLHAGLADSKLQAARPPALPPRLDFEELPRMSLILHGRTSGERRSIAIAAALALLAAAVAVGTVTRAEETTRADRDAPSLAARAEKLLAAKCSQCHGDPKRESGLDFPPRHGACRGRIGRSRRSG